MDSDSWPVSSLYLHTKSSISYFIGRKLEGESKVALIVKTGYKLGVSLGAQEAQVEFSGQEAMDAFWTSTDWITRKSGRKWLCVSERFE